MGFFSVWPRDGGLGGGVIERSVRRSPRYRTSYAIHPEIISAPHDL